LWSPSSSQLPNRFVICWKLLYFVYSCVLCIHTILKSYWMNWDPHLSYLTLGNSQIAWILQAVLGLFMLSIQPLIMCRQNSLVYLLLTRKLDPNWLEKLPFLCHWKISFLFCTHLTGNKLLLRGGHNPSYMYRLIADYYSADDLVVKRRPITGSWVQLPQILSYKCK